jgi:hypothetical protein
MTEFIRTTLRRLCSAWRRRCRNLHRRDRGYD